MNSFGVLLAVLFGIHAIALEPRAFEFEWEPAIGPVVGYEVEVAGRPFLTGPAPESETIVQRFAVPTNRAEITPEVWQTLRIRVRAFTEENIPDGGCPPKSCGLWSPWSTDYVSHILNMDVNGDGVPAGMSEFSVLSLLWGKLPDGNATVWLDQSTP